MQSVATDFEKILQLNFFPVMKLLEARQYYLDIYKDISYFKKL